MYVTHHGTRIRCPYLFLWNFESSSNTALCRVQEGSTLLTQVNVVKRAVITFVVDVLENTRLQWAIIVEVQNHQMPGSCGSSFLILRNFVLLHGPYQDRFTQFGPPATLVGVLGPDHMDNLPFYPTRRPQGRHPIYRRRNSKDTVLNNTKRKSGIMSLAFYGSLVILACVTWFFSARRPRTKKAHLPLPPGPKKWPLIGNLLDAPSEFQWIKYHEWSKQCNSDIIHLNVAGSIIVVVDTSEAAYELFDKRSSIYSSRPRFVMLNELMGWSWLFAVMEYGKSWKQHRTLFQREFHPNVATPLFQPQVTKHTRGLLKRLLQSPDDFMHHISHTTVSIDLDVSYAIDVSEKDDPYVVIAEKALEGFNRASLHGAFLTEVMPILKYIPAWIPGAGFQKKAKEWKHYTKKMVSEPFLVVKERAARGIYDSSFASRCLQNMDEAEGTAQQERIIQGAAANIYAAGFDTVMSALHSLILALLLHPDVQKRAQREIDGVLEGERLPDFEDLDRLPYVTAIVREVQRWQPVTPLAIPHFVTAEDEYKGYRIPANSIVVGNVWAMLHDDTQYPDPFAFKPERWLLSNGKLNSDMKEPTVGFGFGRRICPGRHLASSSIWITAAMLLAVFDFAYAVDKDGNPIKPSQRYCSGLIPSPLPFKCQILPRSQAARELIQGIS
ncbi:cytochrome P450 family protein [Pleurotus pulmonarius]